MDLNLYLSLLTVISGNPGWTSVFTKMLLLLLRSSNLKHEREEEEEEEEVTSLLRQGRCLVGAWSKRLLKFLLESWF
jgi:hypothetical protein